MSLIGLVFLLVLIGVFLWGVNQAKFIDPKMKQIINIVVIIAVIIGILGLFFGGLDSVWNARIGK